MRLNKYLALAVGLSRRSADKIIASGRVKINNQTASVGQKVSEQDQIMLDDRLTNLKETVTIMLNKPVGYVCSRSGQGSSTIYELLPNEYQHLKPVGRLDKDSSGLLLITNDGNLANELTHPKYQKEKIYEVKLNKTLGLADKKELLTGVKLDDGLSKFIALESLAKDTYEVTMAEGRNRQIRRSFAALGYEVIVLHRTKFGGFTIGALANGAHKQVEKI